MKIPILLHKPLMVLSRIAPAIVLWALRLFGALFSFATLSVMMLAVVIGAMFYVYGRDLPSHDELANYAPKTISRIYSGEGRIIDEFAEERRLFAPASEIPDMVKAAFISAEDKNFYTHQGYDPIGMASAFADAIASRGQNLRGASTITQQVMKNFLLSGTRSAERKIKEIILAARIEGNLNKDQILELYLNEIFLGQNSYGVAAAAQTYFNKPLTELLPHEAAYLAALPKAPSNYHPVREYDRAVERRQFVLKEMYENGYLTQKAYDYAKVQPLETVQNGDFNSFRKSLPSRDYHTDEIRRQLSRDYGAAEFFTGGYSVRSTIEPDLQEVAATSLRLGLEEYDRAQGVWYGTDHRISEDKLEDWAKALRGVRIPRDIRTEEDWLPAVVLGFNGADAMIAVEGISQTLGPQKLPAKDITWARARRENGTLASKAKRVQDLLNVGDVVLVMPLFDTQDGAFLRWSLRQIPEIQGGFVAMDVNSGRVLAMQGGFSYEHSVFNRATQAQRQPGSSFKPFVYAAALDSGYSPATLVVDAPLEIETPQGVWRPKNYSDKFYGPTPVRIGIEKSRNLMTIRLAREVGMETVATYAEKFGVYDDMLPVLAGSLGSEETTLYKIVSAYAMFANGGERVQPTLIDRIQDRYGRTVFRHDQRQCYDCLNEKLPAGALPQIITDRERVMDPITAYQLTSMMQGVVDRGTARSTVQLGAPIAGKTGTTSDSKDVWFVGFSNTIAAGCYMGFDQPRTLGKRATGGGMCGPVFARFMEQAISRFGAAEFVIPEGGVFINIDRFNGARLDEDAQGENVVSEYFREDDLPIFGVAYDGGFAVTAGQSLIAQDEEQQTDVAADEMGRTEKEDPKASFGSISSGGLY